MKGKMFAFLMLVFLLAAIFSICTFAVEETSAINVEETNMNTDTTAIQDTSVESEPVTTPTPELVSPVPEDMPDEAVEEAVPDDIVIIEDEEIPIALPELPKTGGIPSVLIFVFGGIMAVSGIFIRNKF